ncbi:MAG: hypothetical protein KBS66_01485 [Eubacterium sp.]|nr:hypothetical protein [Candidatus Colimonas fimequi]
MRNQKNRNKKLAIIISLVMAVSSMATCEAAFATDSIDSGLTKKVTEKQQKALNAGIPVKDQADNPDSDFEVLTKAEKNGTDMRLMDEVTDQGYFMYGDITPNLTILQKNKKAFELTTKTSQKVGYYDTMQGGCTDGKYLYYVLYNRNKENSKIAKIRISDMKVMKVSKALGTEHGNDICYNSDTGMLVVVHNSTHKKRISEIDPTTLKVVNTLDVKIPTSLEGAPDSTVKNIIGFRGISYDPVTDQYVLFCKGRIVFLVLDAEFNPLRVIRPTEQKPDPLMYQGMDLSQQYIYLVESSASYKYYNIIAAYDREGNYVGKIFTRKGWEIENMCHVGSTCYVGFYTAYYKKAYKYVYKYVKKNGKKKKKKVKVSYKKLVRANYTYKFKLQKPVE